MRKILGRILLFSAAFFGAIAIILLVRHIFMGEHGDGVYTSCGFLVTMLYGVLLSINLCYSLYAKRGQEDEKNQLTAGIVLVILGTAICTSMLIVLGVGQYLLSAIAYYIQSVLILGVCVIALRII